MKIILIEDAIHGFKTSDSDDIVEMFRGALNKARETWGPDIPLKIKANIGDPQELDTGSATFVKIKTGDGSSIGRRIAHYKQNKK